jgi:SRSO17 transposase
VSLSIANRHASLPVAYRLYLPQDWASDSHRRRKTGVPEDVSFKTKPEIALEQIEAACEAGLARGVVLTDAGYGCNTNLRTSVSALGLCYVAGILSQTCVWASGTGPLPPKKWSGRGRRPKLIRRDDKHQPVSVKELALGLPNRAWRTIKWREGTAEWLSSRFARVRVRAAHHDYKLTHSRPEEWLLIEWPKGEDEPTKYWLSTHPKDITFRALVASTTTPRCASPPTDSWSPRGRRFPPQDLVAPRSSRNLPFPTVTDPEAPPLRTQRHVPNSITTMRNRLIVDLVRRLSRCPCCATPIRTLSQRRNL